LKPLLLPILTALALPNAVYANEKVSSEMSDIEANKILLGQVLSVCYAVDRNHITMKQKIDILGFALTLHENAHGNKKNKRRSNECCWESPGYLPRLFP
tara:strand:+ start:117 stop:413 length:297 start_codon:yes stop_codon:yes gene_type:complete